MIANIVILPVIRIERYDVSGREQNAREIEACNVTRLRPPHRTRPLLVVSNPSVASRTPLDAAAGPITRENFDRVMRDVSDAFRFAD